VSNKGDVIVLVPGVAGWEIWEGPPPSGLQRKEVTLLSRAGDLEGLPAQDVVFFFPVKDATVMPFKTTTADESLFADLALMHSERMGVRIDPGAGQLIDQFVMEKAEDSAVLTTVVLRAPVDGDLPLRSPKEFDYAPRAYHFDGDGIATWKELGHWVFAFYQKGKMLYAQSTSNDAEHPDETLLRDMRLAQVQLTFQGIQFTPDKILVWHPDGELGEAGALANAYGFPASVGRRPDPTLSMEPSKLLPADVHAERRERAKKQQLTAALSLVALVVVGLLGWVGWKFYQDINATKALMARAKAVEPEVLAFQDHKAKWNELGPVVDQDQWPVENLLRITRSMPQPKGVVRFTEATINANEIRIKGNADNAPPIGQFSFAINKNEELSRYKFVAPPPNNTSKGWEFTIQGAVPQEAQ
jgi:hypothetical protein